MKKLKLYANRTWLKKKYVNDNLSVDDIAEICGVTPRTIYNKLKEFDFL